MSIDEVVREGRFVKGQELLHLGRVPSVFWLKLEFVNASSEKLTRWLEIAPSRLEDVSLFVAREGRWECIEAGNSQPFWQRPVATANAVFPLLLLPGEIQSIYVRVTGRLPTAFTPTLWDPLEFRTNESRLRLADGLVLGGLVVMSLMGFMLLFMFRERAFLFNALALFTFFLGELSHKGYSFMYLWPEATDWVVRGLPMYALLGVGFNLLFLRDLLMTRVKFPRIDRFLLVLLAMEWFPVPGILFSDATIWAQISFPQHFPIMVVMVLVGVYAATRGVKAARYYTVAYAILSLGGGIHGLAIGGMGVSMQMGSYALPVGMLLGNLFLLASVFGRMNEAEQEKSIAQQALLGMRAAHEAILERTVAERTSDLQASLAETRKSRETQSRLVAYISHDLRAPLATIINYIRLLGRHSDDATQCYRDAIERSASYQLELIDDLIEYSRGELEHLELLPAPTYLHDWLVDIARQAELLAAQYDNRFTLEMPRTLPPVIVFDSKRLRQVLINLLQNASKFTNGGDIRLHIEAADLPGRRVAMGFEVRDTGPGILPEDMVRIFLPFERRQSLKEGFGLGLAVAQKLLRAMGSQLVVESSAKGSQFSFRLIMELADEADVLQTMPAFTPPSPFGAGKILFIADDSLSSREFLREILTAANFEIVCMANGREVCARLMQQVPHVIVVDQFMSDMTGWEVLLKVKQVAEIPVILCSAMQPQRPAWFPEGVDFDSALLKPIIPEKLLECLQQRLEGVSQPTKSPGLKQLPVKEYALLRSLVEGGCITEIIEWAERLEAEHQEWADTTRQVKDAALCIDLHRLTGMLDED